MRTLYVGAILALISCECADGYEAAEQEDVGASVVRITSTRHLPDLGRPWTRLPPDEVTGTGLAIEGGRILTNAHVVSYSANIVVQPWQASAKYVARVIASAPGIDLAILEPEGNGLSARLRAVRLVPDLPKIGDPVSALGFPVGGRELSVTEGVVSRIEYAAYYDEAHGLRIQVDAALNPGNSGGPAVSHGNVIGIVFSGMREAENIGYVIPNDEILAFLRDVEDGTYEGRPQAFERVQPIANPALRAMLRVADGVTGLMVLDPWSDDDTYPLRARDVITSIGDHSVDDDGFVHMENGLRLACDYLVPRLTADGAVPVTVWRDGASRETRLLVGPTRNNLVRQLAGGSPSYLICGPLVFTPLYAELADRLDARYLIETSSAIATRRNERATDEEHELVVALSPLLPHRIANGYEVPYPVVLAKLNGEKVRSLRDLAERLGNLAEEYAVFEWADSATQMIVFRRIEMLQATEEILERSGIRSACSSNLADAWPLGAR